jgi:hypothetical protein
MASLTAECPGSWRPAPHFQPGDGVACEHCRRLVMVRPAPVDLSRDPWGGAKEARLEPHPADAGVPLRELVVQGSEG